MRSYPILKRVLLACLPLLIATIASGKPWWTALPERELLLELPMDTETLTADWEVEGELVETEDTLRGSTVLRSTARQSIIRSRASLKPPFEIAVHLRVAERTASSAWLYCGVEGPTRYPKHAFSLRAWSGVRGNDMTLSVRGSRGNTFQSLLPPKGDEAQVDDPTLSLSPRFRSISPVWDPDFRREIEAAVAGVSALETRWFELRLVVREDNVRMLLDGCLVGEYRPGGAADGAVMLNLQPRMHLGGLTVRRLAEADPRFEPCGLDFVCNASGLGSAGDLAIDAASLPGAGERVTVEDIPFRFPHRLTGADHVDVGESIFHYRMQDNAWNMRYLWPAVGQLDRGRLLLKVPNRPYARAWIIAASDSDPNSVPSITLRFYRPLSGFAIDKEAEVPLFTAETRASEARSLPVRSAAGETRNLWLIPVELDHARLAAELHEFDTLSLEITKRVYPYRAYPDPASYGYFQGGPPSAARLFAMTFETAPVRLSASGNRPANVTVLPERPVWQTEIKNLTRSPIAGTLRVTLTDPYGNVERVIERSTTIPESGLAGLDFPIQTEKFGLYDVRTDFEIEDGADQSPVKTVRLDGKLLQLPLDTRRSNQDTSRWGLWTWYGGHGTNPDPEENAYLLRAAGARGPAKGRAFDYGARRKWGLFNGPHITVRTLEKWATEDPYDPEEYAAFSEKIGQSVKDYLAENRDGTYFCFFAEKAVSMEATYGTFPEYLGEDKREWTEAERDRIRAFTLTAKAGMEGIRKAAPKARISFGWCAQQFIIPFLREGFPPELFDVIGIDFPTFEKMPEMPPYDIAPNRMWYLKHEMEQLGYDKPIIHTETYFPSSHELALGHRISADYYVRLAVLSLALGSDRLLHCFSLHDCSGYWGSQHYGCIGIVGRRPEYNPKPAFAAYATMTRLLDMADFEGHVPTASINAYCVAFANRNPALPKHIYCLWTLRGTRDAVLTFTSDTVPIRIDENGNETSLALVGGRTRVTLEQTPFWIVSDVPIEKMDLFNARFAAAPSGPTRLLDTFNAPWIMEEGDYPPYSQAFPVRYRTYPSAMKSEIIGSVQRDGTVWRVALRPPEKERLMAARFAVFRPRKPIRIPGRAKALGIWANGHSDWGRIVYEIEDARGETFISTGKSESWNCNDNHQWSYFNFDGWRYVEFPLPNNLPGDDYRSADSVWWDFDAEGVVDLPVTLRRIIIEHRTHNIYVDKVYAANDPVVELDNLVAVYENASMMTDLPIARQAAPKVGFAPGTDTLPNPFEQLAERGVGAPPEITMFRKPEDWYDGTQIVLDLQPVEGATEYRVYVSAYESGAGASVMAEGAEPEIQVNRLRAEFPLYLFATYLDASKKESRPSPIKRLLLEDDFPFK